MKKKNIKNKKSYARLVGLIFLVAIAVSFVFHQYYTTDVLNKGKEIKVSHIKQKKLFKIAPKEEIMSNNVLRCEPSNISSNKNRLAGKYSLNQFLIKRNIEKLVGNKPMKNMVGEIASRNLETASYLVAIAKHESNLGKFSPKKDGKDCFNYWGFRGSYNKTKSGYSCFDSPEQAVSVVGNRIQRLNEIENINTPEEMLVWKCGSSCAGHNPSDVKRWKENVDYYYKKINS
ncbi:MAG TPA: hypothetical protein DIC35_01650 [Candidatus Moranbacteria bacterium]|nr:hypothetical protein [Candidatus Moranbacteria bacterium]